MVIIGGGPGGYSAALYAARAGLDVVVLEKLSAGGQMALTHQVDNYPGFAEGIDGFTLGMQMQEGAERFGAKTEYVEVLSLDLKADPKRITTSEGDFYGKTVVYAAGAGPRKLDLPEEKQLAGRGIHYCAACDGMFYKGKNVVVVGGGNSAVADALILSRIAQKVILVHRRDTLRAEKVYLKALEEAENLEIRWNSVVSQVNHGDRVSGIILKNVQSDEESEVPCDAVFVSVGRIPNTDLLKGQVELDPHGYAVAGESCRTNIPGVFAVGDVRTKALRQIVTAAADGAIAVHYAEEYLAGLH
jgi:thioredoxin reductase (NADPH)